MIFEWDFEKAAKNLTKHRVSFEEASTVFGDPRSITIYDAEHSTEEDRYVTIGTSNRGRILIVATTDRGESTRIISSRKAKRSERTTYEQG